MTENENSANLAGLYGLCKSLLLPVLIVAFCVVSTVAFAFTSMGLGIVVLLATAGSMYAAATMARVHIQKSLLLGVAALTIPWCMTMTSQHTTIDAGPSWLLVIAGVVGSITSAWMLGKTRVGASVWKPELVPGLIVAAVGVLAMVILENLQIPFARMSTEMLRSLEFAVSLSCVSGIAAYTVRWPVANASRPDVSALLGFISVVLYTIFSTTISLAAFFSYANADLAACNKELLESNASTVLKTAAATVIRNSGGEPMDPKQPSVIETSTEDAIAKGILPFDKFSLPSSARNTTIPLTIANFIGMAGHGRSMWKQSVDLPRLPIPRHSVQNNATVILKQAHSFVYRSTEIPTRDSDASQEKNSARPKKESQDQLLKAFLKSNEGKDSLQSIGDFLTVDDAPNAYWTKYLHTTVLGPIQFVTIIVFWASVLPAASFILVLIRDRRNIDWLQRDLVIFHRTNRIKHAASTVVTNGRSKSLDFPNFALQIADVTIERKKLASFMSIESHTGALVDVDLPVAHQQPSDQDLRVEPANEESFTLQLLVQGEMASVATITAPSDGNRRRISGIERDSDANISLLIASGLGWASEWLKPRFELTTADEEATGAFSVNIEGATHTLMEFRVWPGHEGLASSLSWNQGARDAVASELKEQVLLDVRGSFTLEQHASSPTVGPVSVVGTQIDNQDFTLSINWQFKDRPLSLTLSGITPNLQSDPYVDFAKATSKIDGLTTEILKCLSLDQIPYFVEHACLSTERSTECFIAQVDLKIPFLVGDSVTFPVATLCVKNAPKNGKVVIDVAISDIADGARKFVDFCTSLAQNDSCPFGLRAQARTNAQTPTKSLVELSARDDSQPVIEIRGISTPRSANDPPQFEPSKPTLISTSAFESWLESEYHIPVGVLKARTDKNHREDLIVELTSNVKKEAPISIATFTFRLSPFFDVYDNQLHTMLEDTFRSIRDQSPNANLEEQQSCALVGRVLKGGCTMGTREAMYGVLEQGCTELEERTESQMELVRYGAWLAPSFGFIGTIYGISGAMLQVKEEGLDIGVVSRILGSAFDTTMVALILSMILVFFIHVSSRLTLRLVSSLRNFVNESIIERYEGRQRESIVSEN